MRPFPGCRRRAWLWLKTGVKAHLRRKVHSRLGPITYCGQLGGFAAAGWRAVEHAELCRVCARAAGIRLEEAA